MEAAVVEFPRQKGVSMRKLLCVLVAGIGFAGTWIYPSASEENPCIDDYKKCHNLKELIDLYPPVNDGRIRCIVAANNNLKYGAPEWPSIFNGPKFGSHLRDEKSWRTGQITLVQQGALIPNAYGGKERRTMFCKYDLNTQEVISLYLD